MSSNEVGLTKETAAKYGLKKISDLSRSQQADAVRKPRVPPAAGLPARAREGLGLKFKKFVPVDLALRHEVLEKGQADVSIVFTTDPQNKRDGVRPAG